MNNEWVTWALQGLLGFFGWLIWTKLDKNTGEIHAVKELLLGQYLKKEDFETYRRETRESLHDLRDAVGTQTAKLAAEMLTVSHAATAAAKAAAEAAAMGGGKRKSDHT